MTEGSKEVRVERDGRAMTITLDRPNDQNRLTRDVLLTLQSLVDRLAGDEETQAVEIRSRCHHCGEPLALESTPQGARPEGSGIMLWVGQRTGARCKVADSL